MVVPSPLRAGCDLSAQKGLPDIPTGTLSWPFTPSQQGPGQRVSSRKWGAVIADSWSQDGSLQLSLLLSAGRTWTPAQALPFGACSISQMTGNRPRGHIVTFSKSCPFLGFSVSKQQLPLTQRSLCRQWAKRFVQYSVLPLGP